MDTFQDPWNQGCRRAVKHNTIDAIPTFNGYDMLPPLEEFPPGCRVNHINSTLTSLRKTVIDHFCFPVPKRIRHCFVTYRTYRTYRSHSHAHPTAVNVVYPVTSTFLRVNDLSRHVLDFLKQKQRYLSLVLWILGA